MLTDCLLAKFRYTTTLGLLLRQSHSDLWCTASPDQCFLTSFEATSSSLLSRQEYIYVCFVVLIGQLRSILSENSTTILMNIAHKKKSRLLNITAETKAACPTGVSRKLRPRNFRPQTSDLETSKLQTPWKIIEVVNTVLHECIFLYDNYRD